MGSSQPVLGNFEVPSHLVPAELPRKGHAFLMSSQEEIFVRVIVFDAMGVLYRYGNVQGRVLIPYLRAQGCAAPEEEIRAAYRSVTLGRMTTDEFWPALGLDRRVRRWFVSSDLGARKPDPAAYEAVLGELGVPAEQVLFVDDRPVNRVPARSLGMRAVLFRSDDTGVPSGPCVGSMPELVAAAKAGGRPGRPGRRG